MSLFELFDDDAPEREGGVVSGFRTTIMDILVPLAANGVPYVTVQQVVDKLRDQRSGVAVDRSLIMTVLDPEKAELIKKIEGDRIFLQNPNAATSNVEKKKKEDAEKAEKRTFDKAATQAKKEISKKAAPPKADGGPLAGV